MFGRPRKRFFTLALTSLLILCLLMSGCQATKRETGTAAGAVLGAAAGMFFGRGVGKAVAIGLGAVVGGFVGNMIGGYLDDQDRLALEKESAKALSELKDGGTSKWENLESKAEAEITVVKTETIQRNVPIVRHKEVKKPGTLTMIGEPYEILTDSNVRFGPSMEYDVAKVLKKGSVVLAVGQEKGTNWILVNQDRQAIGYIHASLVGKEGTLAENERKTENSVAVMRPAYDLDEMSGDMASAQTIRPAINLDEMVASYADTPETDDLVAERVDVEAPARTMKMKVVTPHGEEETTVVASKGTDGAWEIL
ncbi:glycine zipper domain-containing protein [Pseudodesulfovibrio pelocollis]|uniref:glycine zipper domain-containing protein n=1 Tax=Pseudodesulfovibrio pelocollis TaxID=3051432 RepID=UPI00255ACA83|nr:glycine zipper domain-containing protein [Pseudodesulfovibrio sp. SB368]